MTRGRLAAIALSAAALVAVVGFVAALVDWWSGEPVASPSTTQSATQSPPFVSPAAIGPRRESVVPDSRDPPAEPATDAASEASVVVEVQDASGAVVPHAQVFSLGHDAESEARVAAHVRQRGETFAPGQRQSVVTAVGVPHAADGRGRVRIPRLVVPQTLVARHGELLGDAVATPDVAGVVVVTIRDDAGLLVVVTDPDGAGVPALEIALFWSQRGPGAPAVTTAVGRTDGAGCLRLESRASWAQGLLASDGLVDAAVVIPDVPGGQFLGVPARLREPGAGHCQLTVALALLEVSWADGPPPTTGALRIGTDGERGPTWCRAIGDVLARPVRLVPGRRYAIELAESDRVARADVVVPATTGAVVKVALRAEPLPASLTIAARLTTADGPVDGPVDVRLMSGVPADASPVAIAARAVSVRDGRLTCSFAADPAPARWLLVEAQDCAARRTLPAVHGSTDLGEIRLLPREPLARVVVDDPERCCHRCALRRGRRPDRARARSPRRRRPVHRVL
jgi:hypothetical protein